MAKGPRRGSAAVKKFEEGAVRENPSASDVVSGSIDLCLSPKEFFFSAVSDAIAQRKLRTTPFTPNYLVEVLEHHMMADNLFDETDPSGKRSRETLAELFLKAQAADLRSRVELLKKLADRSLYISGFFGDSLQRKLIDVDYYIGMGGAAYASLAQVVSDEVPALTFKELSAKFIDFVDVFTSISTLSRTHDEKNILRLYELYAKTGSELARERLHEKGLIAVPVQDPEKH